jgi:hypothetical protein
MVSLTPLNGYVLVELGSKYKHISAPAKIYDAKSNGIVIKGDKELIGKRVYWQDYKEGSTLTEDNREYTFVKLEDLQGWSND